LMTDLNLGQAFGVPESCDYSSPNCASRRATRGYISEDGILLVEDEEFGRLFVWILHIGKRIAKYDFKCILARRNPLRLTERRNGKTVVLFHTTTHAHTCGSSVSSSSAYFPAHAAAQLVYAEAKCSPGFEWVRPLIYLYPITRSLRLCSCSRP
jgi:hypothetical protein